MSFVLNNLKKLIKEEEENIKKTENETSQFEKLKKIYAEVSDEKNDNQQKLVKEIKKNLENKYKFDMIYSKGFFLNFIIFFLFN